MERPVIHAEAFDSSTSDKRMAGDVLKPSKANFDNFATLRKSPTDDALCQMGFPASATFDFLTASGPYAGKSEQAEEPAKKDLPSFIPVFRQTANSSTMEMLEAASMKLTKMGRILDTLSPADKAKAKHVLGLILNANPD